MRVPAQSAIAHMGLCWAQRPVEVTCEVTCGEGAPMREFSFQAQPSRVIFGLDSLERAPEEIERLGARRPLILHSAHCKGAAEALGALLGDRLAGIYEGSAAHT